MATVTGARSCPGGATPASRRWRSQPLIEQLPSVRHRDAATPTLIEPSRTAWPPGRPRRPGAPLGEPYITHPLGGGADPRRLGLDDVTIAAALLHDAVEDTGLTLDEIEERFGPDVAAIVDGVTKLDRLQFDSKEAQQAATMRKMLVAMAKDLRVLLIKLADRLHNMRTIAVAARRGSRSAPPRRPSTSTPRWRTGSACRR